MAKSALSTDITTLAAVVALQRKGLPTSVKQVFPMVRKVHKDITSARVGVTLRRLKEAGMVRRKGTDWDLPRGRPLFTYEATGQGLQALEKAYRGIVILLEWQEGDV